MEGIEYTVRPNGARLIPWKSVRSMEGDGKALYVITGFSPIVIPRRAFANEAKWRAFVDYARASAAELRKSSRSPIGRSASSTPTNPYDPNRNPFRTRRASFRR